MKNLKRNVTITIASVSIVLATLFIGNEAMVKILIWLEIALFILLLGISLLLIVNTIKIAVFSRKSEISIMKFVGVTDWFIRWPFIIEGLVIGIIGAFLGNLSLFFVYNMIYTKAMEFAVELSLVQPI